MAVIVGAGRQRSSPRPVRGPLGRSPEGRAQPCASQRRQIDTEGDAPIWQASKGACCDFRRVLPRCQLEFPPPVPPPPLPCTPLTSMARCSPLYESSREEKPRPITWVTCAEGGRGRGGEGTCACAAGRGVAAWGCRTGTGTGTGTHCTACRAMHV